MVSFADWAAPPVHALKQDGNVQISSDISVTINQASKLDQYPLHELKVCFLLCLPGGRTFTKLDTRQAYQQLLLDEDSELYNVINTPKVLFQYNYLPFGISSAPGMIDIQLEDSSNLVIQYMYEVLVKDLHRYLDRY